MPEPNTDPNDNQDPNPNKDDWTLEKLAAERERLKEKERGLDAKFREAAELRKQAEKVQQAETAMEAMSLHEKVANGLATPSEMNRYCDLFDVSDDYRQALLHPEADNTPEDKNKPNPTPGPVRMDQLDPELRRKLEKTDEIAAKQAADECTASIKKGIDTAEVFSKMLKDIDPKLVDDFKDTAEGQVRNELIVRMRAGQRYSPQLVADAVDSVGKTMQKMGSYQKRTENPAPGPFGIGNASASLATQIPEGKPPERVAGDDPNYETNFTQRFIHRLVTGQK